MPSSLKVMLTKCGIGSCGTKVTSYNPRLLAATSALTEDLPVVTTSSSVPSPAWLASTVKVTGLPAMLLPSKPVTTTRPTSYTLHVNGDPTTGWPSNTT